MGCVITGRLSRINANDFIGAPLGTAHETVLISRLVAAVLHHSSSNLEFGADGALYVSAGEGANPNYVDFGPPVASAKPSIGRSTQRRRRAEESGTSGPPVIRLV